MTSAVEIGRAARAALRKAFPGTKFSVTSDHYQITVRWTDDGPTVEKVQDTLLAAGCAGLRRELEKYGERLSEGRRRQVEDDIAEHSRRLEAIDAEDLINAKAYRDRQRMRQRALELARVRMLEFIGAPDVQMQTAARLWGCCCRCGKTLTDPISLERGIGPDCYALKINSIRYFANEGWKLESIAAVVGMPVEFISTVLHEGRAL